jgi:tol-pal system protein YbgF
LEFFRMVNMRTSAKANPVRRHAGMAVVGLALALSSAGCATKKDMKLLREEVIMLQLRQDSLFRASEAQNRYRMQEMMDTLRTTFLVGQQNVGGTLGNQIRQILDQQEEISVMLGQQQQRIDQIQRDQAGRPVAVAGQGGQAPGGDCEPEVCYQLGIQKSAEGSYATARFAFLEVLRQPEHPLAAEAQFQIGETYYLERNFAQAMTELEKVPQQWPGSERAPHALFRAGVIAQEQNDRAKARQYYQQVVQRYPQSEVRRQAEDRLRAIR